VASDLADAPFDVVLRDDNGGVIYRKGTRASLFADVAVPVYDPRNGHVIGALEMSSPIQGGETLVNALARRVAQEIEHRLLDEVGMVDKAVLYHFLRERHRTKGPFVFVNDHAIVPNAAAHRLVGRSDEDLLRQWAAVLAERSCDEPAPLTLTSGATVLVSAEAVRRPAQSPGVLLHLKSQPRFPSSPPRLTRTNFGVGWDSLTETECSVAELVSQGPHQPGSRREAIYFQAYRRLPPKVHIPQARPRFKG
jgi:hypothetical protein